MNHDELIGNQKLRSFIFFSLFLFLIIIFLAKMSYEAFGNRSLPSQTTTINDKSVRGKIITADGFTIGQSSKLYKAYIYAPGINPNKRELFVNLFSIYSGISINEVKKRMGKFDRNVILSYKIDATTAKYLKELSRKLYSLNVYRRLQTKEGLSLEYKLEIQESGESRDFFYSDTLTPLIGHMTKVDDAGYTKSQGLKGVEKSYENELSKGQNGFIMGKRDVRGDVILDSNSILQKRLNGYNIHLNVDLKLQKRVEQVLDAKKDEFNATEMVAIIMDSMTGKVISFASSNRYNPSNIKQNEISYLNPTATEHLYEPGSVIKPITFALLLENNKVNPLELIKTEGGRWRLGGHLITDEHKHMWLSAENVIVYSSNIGTAKLAQRLEGYELYEGFEKFGLTSPTGIDLPYEKRGRIQNVDKLNKEIYKATSAYGYGLVVNVMQLLKAHATFNNGGYLVQPQIANKIENGIKTYLQKPRVKQIISQPLATQINRILQKVVKDGSAQNARYEGLTIGGKTGTAHISVSGEYENLYHSTFVGFANDTNSRYSIAVLTREPKIKYRHFASLTSVPTFKEIVEQMVQLHLLKPSKKE